MSPGMIFQRGFTLVELVSVIVLLGIMTAVIAPRFLTLRDYEARGYYDEVAAASRYAQKLAVVSGCDVQMAISSAGLKLRKRQLCDTSSAFSRTLKLPGKDVDTLSPPADLSVSAATVIFSPLGEAINTMRIPTDYSLNIGSRTIQIVGETGYVVAL